MIDVALTTEFRLMLAVRDERRGSVAAARTRQASRKEKYRQMVKTPIFRWAAFGQSEEFADIIAYLLSDRSCHVTGSAINLGGGTSQSSNPLPASSGRQIHPATFTVCG